MVEIANPKSEFEPVMDNHQFKEGMKAALPIVLGYLPVGVAFGVLARKAGLSPLETGSMSFLVYAGASQFIAVEMISNGISLVPIVLTTLFINLRHLLMSSTVSLYFNHPSLRMMGLLSAQLTDESFAVAMADPSKISNRPRYLVCAPDDLPTRLDQRVCGRSPVRLFHQEFVLWYPFCPARSLHLSSGAAAEESNSFLGDGAGRCLFSPLQRTRCRATGT